MDKYDNVIIIGDINIYTHDFQLPGYAKLINSVMFSDHQL